VQHDWSLFLPSSFPGFWTDSADALDRLESNRATFSRSIFTAMESFIRTGVAIIPRALSDDLADELQSCWSEMT
jgi:hypothetical protein